jgi:hypothetical protein
MAFQKVVDTVEVTLVFQQNLENLTNTFHAEKPGGYSQEDIETLAAGVDTLVASEILPIITLDATYLRTEVRGLAVENDLFATDAASTGVGEQAVEGLPNSVTISLKKSSAFTGRSARGRWYWIGLPESNLGGNENQVTSAKVALIVAAIEALRGGVLAGAFTPVIVSRFTGGAQRSEGKTFDWIDTVAVNENVDSQRSRLAG